MAEHMPGCRRQRPGDFIRNLAFFVCGCLVTENLLTRGILHSELHHHSASYYVGDANADNASRTFAAELSSSAAALMDASTEKNNEGWSSINVFYGDQSHLHVNVNDEDKNIREVSDADDGQVWKSQAGQDKLVYQLTKQLKGGYFVDLASNDATAISNSYILETNHGWKGLCIEPNSKYWSRLAYRKCTVVGAVVGHNRMDEIEFYFGREGSQQVVNYEPIQLESGMFGGIMKDTFDNKPENTSNNKALVKMKRSTVTLQEIFERFDAPTTIDYLSLDVEGAESFVMQGFPFDKYRFKIMTVERPKKDLVALLQEHGYTLLRKINDWGETFFINESLRDELDLTGNEKEETAQNRREQQI